MDRLKLATLAFLSLPLLGIPRDAQAIEWWHDPARGCGTLDGWQRTGRMQDIPGCSGELPKGAPPGEVAMQGAKKALIDAEKQLDAGQTAGVEAKLDAAVDIMNKAPADPRVNWARPLYQKAVAALRARLAIVPKLPKLRQAFKDAMDAIAQANAQKTDAARKAAVAAADACAQAFKDAESQGADLSLPVELTAGKPRPLRDDLHDCASGKSSLPEVAAQPEETKPAGGDTAATPDKPAAPAAGNDGGVPRAKWAKALKGDRKKVFNEHPDAFPEFDGDPGPKGAMKAAEWRYGSEVFQFKHNKLVKPKKK